MATIILADTHPSLKVEIKETVDEVVKAMEEAVTIQGTSTQFVYLTNIEDNKVALDTVLIAAIFD